MAGTAGNRCDVNVQDDASVRQLPFSSFLLKPNIYALLVVWRYE